MERWSTPKIYDDFWHYLQTEQLTNPIAGERPLPAASRYGDPATNGITFAITPLTRAASGSLATPRCARLLSAGSRGDEKDL